MSEIVTQTSDREEAAAEVPSAKTVVKPSEHKMTEDTAAAKTSKVTKKRPEHEMSTETGADKNISEQKSTEEAVADDKRIIMADDEKSSPDINNIISKIGTQTSDQEETAAEVKPFEHRMTEDTVAAKMSKVMTKIPGHEIPKETGADEISGNVVELSEQKNTSSEELTANDEKSLSDKILREWHSFRQDVCKRHNISDRDLTEILKAHVTCSSDEQSQSLGCAPNQTVEATVIEKTKSHTHVTRTMGNLSSIHSYKIWTLCLCNFLLPVILVALATCVAFLWNNAETLGSFSIKTFFVENSEIAAQWELLDRQTVHILVTGKTGTGKSALINGLMGENVTKEGDTLDPATSQVQEIKQMVHGISMSVFDSPGLQDGTKREGDYLRDMERKCKNVDLVLYTIKMTDQRVLASDTSAMKKLTSAFGPRFWEKAMFVMTFANEVISPEYPYDELENRKHFEERLKLWKEKLPGYIKQRAGIPIDIGKDIPIVPAGYYKIRDLPGRKYWFSQFWKDALDRMMESSAEGAGYMLQYSQDRLKHHNDTSEEDFEKPIHRQPILSKIVDEDL